MTVKPVTIIHAVGRVLDSCGELMEEYEIMSMVVEGIPSQKKREEMESTIRKSGLARPNEGDAVRFRYTPSIMLEG